MVGVYQRGEIKTSIESVSYGVQSAISDLAVARLNCTVIAPNKKPSTRLGLFFLDNQGLIGRRDWTRTNDPHHVKVVL